MLATCKLCDDVYQATDSRQLYDEACKRLLDRAPSGYETLNRVEKALKLTTLLDNEGYRTFEVRGWSTSDWHKFLDDVSPTTRPPSDATLVVVLRMLALLRQVRESQSVRLTPEPH